MIGREKEFNALTAWLKTAVTVKRGALLVAGPAGIGKSRLIQEACRYAMPQLSAITLRCDDQLQKPYQIFGYWLRQRFLGPSSLKYQDPASAFARNYNRLVATLPYRKRLELESGTNWILWLAGINQAEHQKNLKPETVYELAANTLFALFAAECELYPVLIIVKNIQAIDHESAKLLQRLCKNGIILIATRQAIQPGSARDAGLLESFDDIIKLKPLSRPETRELVHALSANNGSHLTLNDSVIDAIYQQTEGIPFLIEQLTLTVQENILQTSNKLEPFIAGLQNEHSIILQRYQQFPLSLQQTIMASAVIGRIFSLDILDQLMDSCYGTNSSSTRVCIQHGISAGLWHSSGDREFCYNQNILQECILNTIDPDQRRNLHIKCASILQELHAENLDGYAHEIAPHCEQFDPILAAAWYEKAAALANKESRQHQALDFYQKALKLSEAHGSDRMFELLRKMAECAQQAGQIEKAKQSYQLLLDRSRLCDNVYEESWALSGLGHIADLQSERETALQMLRQALVLAETSGNKDATMITWGRLGMVLDSKQDWEAARDAYQQKLRLAQISGNEAAIISSLNNIGLVYLGEHKYAESIRILQQLTERLSVNGDPVVLSKVFGNLAYAYDEKGNIQAAASCYGQQFELASRYGYKLGTSIALCGLGCMALKRGDYSEANSRLQEAVSIGSEIGIKYYTSEYNFFFARALLEQKQPARAIACLKTSLADAEADEREDIIARARPALYRLETLYENDPEAKAAAYRALAELANTSESGPESRAFASLELWRLGREADRQRHRDSCLDLFAGLFTETGRDEYARILNELQSDHERQA